MRKLAHMTMTNARYGAGALIPEFTVNDKMRKAREMAEITREVMAEQIGVSVRSIIRYENGGNVPKSAVLLYAMATTVPAEWIDPTRCTPRDLNPEPTDSGSGRVVQFPRVLTLAAA